MWSWEKLIKVVSLLTKKVYWKGFTCRPSPAFCCYRKKNRITMQAIQTLASALGSYQRIFLQGLWKRTNWNDSRTNSVFIKFFFFFLHFFLLLWLDSRFSRKPTKHEACIHANISGVISLCHGRELNNVIYYIDTDEIPGFFLVLKNHIFFARSEGTIFIFHVWGYWCRHSY